MDDVYHLRRIEREMPDRADQLAVLSGQKFLSLAMARDNEPYLVSLNYAYSEVENCFYVHSALQGRKLDYLRANARVWGQVIEDRGYLPGQCSHAYRSVMFRARAEFVEEPQEKKRALAMMIDHADPEPASLRQRLLDGPGTQPVVVIRLIVESMTGKQGA
jgi:uncharacterized protein